MSHPSNILVDPIPELATALKTNSWGIDPTSAILVASSFPITPDDVESVKLESKSSGRTSTRVVGKARIVTLEGDEMIVQLDQRGFTLETSSNATSKTYPRDTYETLEALLIAVSPKYVEAMTREVGKRFEGRGGVDQEEREGEGEVEMAEGGEKEVWR